jgi:phosphoenolpyruvate phosphomutase
MTKAVQLRKSLNSERLTFLLEAHNALSAKIVEESGFEAIWASGLSISASLGLADRNESSWTQVLEIVEFMSDCTSVPILVDGDCGYGNFNNAQRFARKLSARDAAVPPAGISAGRRSAVYAGAARYERKRQTSHALRSGLENRSVQ